MKKVFYHPNVGSNYFNNGFFHDSLTKRIFTDLEKKHHKAMEKIFSCEELYYGENKILINQPSPSPILMKNGEIRIL